MVVMVMVSKVVVAKVVVRALSEGGCTGGCVVVVLRRLQGWLCFIVSPIEMQDYMTLKTKRENITVGKK